MEDLIAQIVSALLVAALVFIPVAYAAGKQKLKKVIRCLQQVDKAIEDDKISREEIKTIWEVCRQLWE